MKRRDFSNVLIHTGLAGTALSLGLSAQAQGGPVEGKDYVKLGQPLAVPGTKIEVLEFFWYGCPHCNAFEPNLEAWVRKLPADVAFRRVPVSFREEPFVNHQKIFYALEALGQLEAMHRKVFYAIHVERAKLDKPDEIAAFVAKNGVDSAQFLDAFKSFAVANKANQAKQLSAAYKIDGVPALGIHGRYFTSGSLAGSTDRSLVVADFLIQRARKPA